MVILSDEPISRSREIRIVSRVQLGHVPVGLPRCPSYWNWLRSPADFGKHPVPVLPWFRWVLFHPDEHVQRDGFTIDPPDLVSKWDSGPIQVANG